MIAESPTSNIAIVGDFNAAIDTQFDVELQELCNNLSLVISDCNFYGRNSGMFTHVSDAHGNTSWLDNVVCSQDMQTKLHSIAGGIEEGEVQTVARWKEEREERYVTQL